MEITLVALRTCDSIKPGRDIRQIVVSPRDRGSSGGEGSAEIDPVRLRKTGFAKNAIGQSVLGVPGQFDSISVAGRRDADWWTACDDRRRSKNALARIVVRAAGGGLQSNGSDHVSV